MGIRGPFPWGGLPPNETGKLYQIGEYYGVTGTPNEGVRLAPDEIARRIRRLEEENPILRGRDIVGVADPSIFDESRGESIAVMMGKGAALCVVVAGG